LVKRREQSRQYDVWSKYDHKDRKWAQNNVSSQYQKVPHATVRDEN